jgi:hypothetical protein
MTLIFCRTTSASSKLGNLSPIIKPLHSFSCTRLDETTIPRMSYALAVQALPMLQLDKNGLKS